MTSPCSKPGISLPVGVAVPFGKSAERVFDAAVRRLRQNHPGAVDLISEFVTFHETEGGADGLRYSCLSFARQLTGDHGCQCKENPYRVKHDVRRLSLGEGEGGELRCLAHSRTADARSLKLLCAKSWRI